ncbi:MAG: tRNA pseudouridine(55) synthase TruB [bacterium]
MAHRALVLSVFKPPGPTSFDVVRRIRALLGYKKVGHAGTLDPPASGVLIVLCGEATKWAADFADLDKRYRATIRFGVETTTDDLTGEILREYPLRDWTHERIRDALKEFEGDILQVPPAVSAVKIGGERSYKKARRGETPELTPRRVSIGEIRLLEVAKPDIHLDISCGKGTYIRSLARDVGKRLGWGGAIAHLVRSAVGPYQMEHALSLEQLTRLRDELAG